MNLYIVKGVQEVVCEPIDLLLTYLLSFKKVWYEVTKLCAILWILK